VAWFGNGLSTGIDPGFQQALRPRPSVPLDPAFQPKPIPTYPSQPLDPGLVRPKVDPTSYLRQTWSPAPKPVIRDEFEASKDELDRAHALKKAEEWARTHESDGEYFRRTGQQRGEAEYREGVRSRRQAEFDERATNFDWSTATDDFEASKTALDRQHQDKKRAGTTFYYDRDGIKRYYVASSKPRVSKPIFSTPTSTVATTTSTVAIDPAFQTTAPVTSPTPPTLFTPPTPPTSSTVAIDRGLTTPSAYHQRPSRPAPATLLKPKPFVTTLPSAGQSLLDAKKHLNVVKPADKRPVPSYLDDSEDHGHPDIDEGLEDIHANPHKYDNPVRDTWLRRYDHKSWRVQDRIVALAPFNKPNTPEWDDPDNAVKASAKLRKAIEDTNYTEKRAAYVHAKSDKEDAAALVKQIKANVKDLREAKGLSGFGHTGPESMTDMISYWEGKLTDAKSDLTAKTTAYNAARSEEMNAGRKVKEARNEMNRYLMRGPYSKDTRVTYGTLIGAALGGLIVYNIIMPLPAKRRTRKYNPLYSVFA